MDHAVGNGVYRNEQTALVGVLREQLAVGRMHARHDGRLVLRQLAVFGQRLVGFPNDVNHDARDAEEHDKAGAKHKAQESQHA